MTYKETKIYIRKELSDFYNENEIRSFTKLIFEDIFNISFVNLLANEKKRINKNQVKLLKKTTLRLKKFEPIQYIIGQSEFYGLKFIVNKNVLIPRPETEELVDLIINENNKKSNLQILDVGTGSGCIAVSLSKNLKTSNIYAIDIDLKALNIASKNSKLNNTKISVFQTDILSAKNNFTSEKFDIIVSNPPYVTHSEKKYMEQNVLKYEPELALFVNDNSPIIFYIAIAKFAKKNLTKNGKLYFEINEQFGKEIVKMLISEDFSDVQILKDIYGKNRIIKCFINTLVLPQT